MTLAVALSMALTPVLLILHARLLARAIKPAREADAIEDASAEVIIAKALRSTTRIRA